MNFKQLWAIKKGKDKTGLFFIEGPNAISEIPKNVTEVYIISETYDGDIPGRAKFLSEKKFLSLSDAKTPQGIIAVCRRKILNLKDLENLETDGSIIICERIQDPGNVGAIIRSAVAFGANAAIFVNCASAVSPKALRASAGAYFALPVFEELNLLEVVNIIKRKRLLIAGAPNGETGFDKAKLKNAAFLIGNEGSGLSTEALNLADVKISISINKIQSLNAAIAASIFLYEAAKI